MPLHRNRPDRTGGITGAATGATLEIQLGAGNTTETWPKPDRRRFAVLAADTALDATVCKTGFDNHCAQRPGGSVVIANQHRRPTGGDAVAAEGAFTGGEIDTGITAIARPDYTGWTDPHTVIAARAKGFEAVGVDGPRRTDFIAIRADAAPQEAAA